MKNMLMLSLLLVFPLLIWLQLILAKHKNKILGLILPLFSFIVISIPRIVSVASINLNQRGLLSFIIPMLLIVNIPTIIFIIIYIICRKETNINEEKISKEIRKMNIQDLD